VRPFGVVVDPPCFDDVARLLEAAEEVLVEALSRSRRLKLSTRPICVGLPGAM
jgi:hypothetical protein